jgi:glycine dehydrogenase subunit 1
MSFVPNTDDDLRRMLDAVGAASVEELFRDVPGRFRYPELDLPPALAEMDALRELGRLAAENADCARYPCFLGAGAYRHFIPSIVETVVSRSEFATAYTPYQPEISQGTLQAMFEYQTLIARLTGMEASNASHYDGATAAAEAVIMATHVFQGERRRVLLSRGVHPQYRRVIRVYTQGMGLEVTGDLEAGSGDSSLLRACDEATACVVVQSPDFFGRVREPEELRALAERVHDRGGLLVVAANPIALGVLCPPGECGADIAVGEGQALGSPLSFGGPYLGFMAFRKEHIRRSSGRIAGETVDARGRRGYVFTLNTREQHIRREKATSNICTNQSLNALAAAVYLSALGPRGLRRVAELCYQKAHYAAEKIAALPGYAVAVPGGAAPGDFFHEFAVRCPVPAAKLNGLLLEKGIIGGFDLGADYPELAGCMLLCCTEMNTKAEIDALVEALAGAAPARPKRRAASGRAKLRARPKRGARKRGA